MRVGALCAGIGGLELGLTLAGEDVELVWVADTDPHASLVLATRFGVPNLGDVKSIETTPPVDLIVAGTPCQPVSKVGRKKGTSDDRWLIRDVVRVACAAGASGIYLENVPGMLTLAGGDPFRQVLNALAERGFDARWTHLRASDVGAAHRRNRWFCLATANSNSQSAGRNDRGTSETEEFGGWKGKSEGYGSPSRSHSSPTREFNFGPFTPAVERWERQFGPAPEPLDSQLRVNPVFTEWLMGFPKGWVTDIISQRTHSLRLLGNSVVPQAAAAAWLHLKEMTNED